MGGRIAAGWSGDDNGHTLAGTVAGKASDSLQWMLTATTRGAHALDNMGSNDEPNTRRTRPNPQDDRDNAVLGKIVVLVLLILFIQRRPRGMFPLKGRAVEA